MHLTMADVSSVRIGDCEETYVNPAGQYRYCRSLIVTTVTGDRLSINLHSDEAVYLQLLHPAGGRWLVQEQAGIKAGAAIASADGPPEF